MTAKQAIKCFNTRLLKELPLDNNIFLGLLGEAELFPFDYEAKIRTLPIRSEKVAFFKEHVLEPGPDLHLPTLLSVIDKCDDFTAKRLAQDIREEMGLCKCNYNVRA